MTAGLSSYKPSRGVYASRSAGVLSNKVITSGDNKGWALWVTKLYYKLISFKNYLNRGNKRNYILSAFFVPNAEMYKSCWIYDPSHTSDLKSP